MRILEEIMHDDKKYEDSRYGKRMGMKSSLDKLEDMVSEIYECGYKDGYHKAHEESEYGERGSYRRSMR